MLEFRELQALEVSEQEFSQAGKKFFADIVQVAKIIRTNSQDPRVELAVLEKILALQMKKDRLRSEINLLSINQEVCKDSVILLTSIEELMPVAQYIDKTENFKSLSKEVEDLEKKVGSFSIPNYDESINHRNLLEISNEIDLLIKDVDKLQEKNELFGDFPTVIYK